MIKGFKKMSQADERVFQDEIIEALVGNGWLKGDTQKYDRKCALAFVRYDNLGRVR